MVPLDATTVPHVAPGPEPVTVSVASNGPGATPTAPRGKFTRKPPSLAEQARREAWGKQWGSVGRDWKQAHNPKGK